MFHKLSGKFTQCNPKTEHREMATYQLQTTGEQADEALARALRPQNAMRGDETTSGAYVLTDAEGKAFDPQTSASAVLMKNGGTVEEEFVRQVGNIRISALESLVDGAGSKEIAANAASKYAFAEWPLLKEVCGGDELTLSVGAIEVLKGSADVFTVSLLDPDYKTHLAPQSELTRESLTHVFKVTEGVAKQPATVLIYAGKIGSTAGNTVRVSDVVLSWSPSPPQQQQQMDVLAHSDCTLEERIAHLERLLVGVLSGKVLIPELQVKKLGVWGDNNLVVTGEGAPAKAPDRAGQFYIDTAADAVYHSVNNNAVSGWKNN